MSPLQFHLDPDYAPASEVHVGITLFSEGIVVIILLKSWLGWQGNIVHVPKLCFCRHQAVEFGLEIVFSRLSPVLAFILVKSSFSFCLILPLSLSSSCFRCCFCADEGTYSFAVLKPGRAMLTSWKLLWYSQAQDMAMCHLY